MKTCFLLYLYNLSLRWNDELLRLIEAPEGETQALARISEHFQAARRTSWRFKWRFAGDWFAENQPWSVPKNTKYRFKIDQPN